MSQVRTNFIFHGMVHLLQAIQQLQNKSPQHVPAPQMGHPGPADAVMVGAAMDIFRTLAVELDTEGRYLFLNAVANQLRYPNNHTHYFSFVLLFLFFEAKQVSLFIFLTTSPLLFSSVNSVFASYFLFFPYATSTLIYMLGLSTLFPY